MVVLLGLLFIMGVFSTTSSVEYNGPYLVGLEYKKDGCQDVEKIFFHPLYPGGYACSMNDGTTMYKLSTSRQTVETWVCQNCYLQENCSPLTMMTFTFNTCFKMTHSGSNEMKNSWTFLSGNEQYLLPPATKLSEYSNGTQKCDQEEILEGRWTRDISRCSDYCSPYSWYRKLAFCSQTDIVHTVAGKWRRAMEERLCRNPPPGFPRSNSFPRYTGSLDGPEFKILNFDGNMSQPTPISVGSGSGSGNGNGNGNGGGNDNNNNDENSTSKGSSTSNTAAVIIIVLCSVCGSLSFVICIIALFGVGLGAGLLWIEKQPHLMDQDQEVNVVSGSSNQNRSFLSDFDQ